jgi:hypothetical protein
MTITKHNLLQHFTLDKSLSAIIVILLFLCCSAAPGYAKKGGTPGPPTKYKSPVAVVAADQTTVVAGTTVNLTASGSYDFNSQPLTYSWSLSAPYGSSAALSSSTSSTTSFTPDVAGNFVATLTVNDGTSNSNPSSITVVASASSLSDTPPVANAGANQTVTAGSTVQLNGSASSDPDGSALTYQWSMQTKPSGSAAALSNSTAVNPTFKADLAGTYTISLIVNDGTLSSSPSTVTVTANPAAVAPPVANAGTNQTVKQGATVQLNGSASSDPNGLTLTYSWTLTTKPSGSAAALSNPTTAKPTFTADVAGSFVASLTVSNGSSSSSPSTVTVTAVAAPVANAGTSQSVTVGNTVTLNGSASTDPNGLTLTYSWTLTSKPSGSAAALSNPTTAKPTFTADVAGSFVASLTVSNGYSSSSPSTVTVTAVASNPGTNPNPTTYYISPSGSDSNSGSQSSPFKSIQQAANIVNPGDTVMVQSGTYQTTDPNKYAIVSLNRGGTASQWITFQCQPGVVLDGQSKTTAYGWVLGTNASYMVIQGSNIQNCQLAAILSSAQSHDYNLVGNYLYACGMSLQGNNVTVRNNTIVDVTGTWGLNFAGNNWTIDNNSFSLNDPNVPGHINIGGSSSNVQITHNLSVKPNTMFINIYPTTSTFSNVVVSRNFTTVSQVIKSGTWSGITESNDTVSIGP